ncbi:diguanylate cyclase [Billgrantia gudaonensis]|uniref:Diguanylate cyclase n=1 Tax=Billgrantia gudaonensis TaxID=376427 RepID=A0A3S0NX81_9GAMM|nr:diguanylate cyclase [Halomonas gudaonensis]
MLDAELLACEHSHEPRCCSSTSITKRINDTHGHDAGDRVLYHLAQETLARLRTSDHLGRWVARVPDHRTELQPCMPPSILPVGCATR